MKKLGFTLAEVLLTLGIVGVIAAITMPALQVNIQKQTVGPALAKAISTLESANKILLSQENARNLAEVCVDIKDKDNKVTQANGNYLNCLTNNNVLKATVSDFSSVRTFKLGSFSGIKNNNSVKYTLEDGLDIYALNEIDNAGINPQFHSTNYTVYVDVNGPKQPNAIGRDVFRLLVNAGGDVVAYGSASFKNIKPGGASWKLNCNANGVKDNGELCAGSVVDNGYKVIYPF